MSASEEKREEIRRALLDQVPRGYRPWLHLASQGAVGLVVAAVALTLLRGLRPLELLTVPLTLLAANAAEWRVHKDLFHRRRGFAKAFYDRHTPEHHLAYVDGDLAIRSARELRWVLAPAWGVPLIVAFTTPVGYLIALGPLGRNVGALFAASCALFAAGYELLHLCYHLDPNGVVGRRRWLAPLRRHHSLHHDPKLMQRYNFNVTLPLWDWVRGTIYRPPTAS